MTNRTGEARFYYGWATFEAAMTAWLFYVGDIWQGIGTLILVPIITSFVGLLRRRERLGWLLGRSEMRIAFYEATLSGMTCEEWLRQEADRDNAAWNDLLVKRKKKAGGITA